MFTNNYWKYIDQNNFQEQFGKSYRSPAEARQRLIIFKKNLEKIEQHNALFENGETTYTKGINQFTDWSSEEFLQYVDRGFNRKPVIVGDIFNESVFAKFEPIDWRTYGIVTPVKNQGQCGCSWAFSAVSFI